MPESAKTATVVLYRTTQMSYYEVHKNAKQNKLPPTPLNFSALAVRWASGSCVSEVKANTIHHKQAVLLTSLPHTVFFPDGFLPVDE